MGYDKAKSSNQYLEKNLMFSSDVAIHFLEKFSKDFNVDFSQLDVTKKFECDLLHLRMVKFFKAIFLRQKHLLEYEDIKISELIIAAQSGKWIEENHD